MARTRRAKCKSDLVQHVSGKHNTTPHEPREPQRSPSSLSLPSFAVLVALLLTILCFRSRLSSPSRRRPHSGCDYNPRATGIEALLPSALLAFLLVLCLALLLPLPALLPAYYCQSSSPISLSTCTSCGSSSSSSTTSSSGSATACAPWLLVSPAADGGAATCALAASVWLSERLGCCNADYKLSDAASCRHLGALNSNFKARG